MVTADLERLRAAFSERTRVDRELGAGGMATVYQAYDLERDRSVAVTPRRPELSAIRGGWQR